MALPPPNFGLPPIAAEALPPPEDEVDGDFFTLPPLPESGGDIPLAIPSALSMPSPPSPPPADMNSSLPSGGGKSLEKENEKLKKVIAALLLEKKNTHTKVQAIKKGMIGLMAEKNELKMENDRLNETIQSMLSNYERAIEALKEEKEKTKELQKLLSAGKETLDKEEKVVVEEDNSDAVLDELMSLSLPMHTGGESLTSPRKNGGGVDTIDIADMMSEAKSPSAEKSPSKHSQRARVLEEFVTTEYTYVVSLSTLSRVYYNPIEREGILSPSEQRTIFSDFEIIHNLNKQFLQDLRHRVYDEAEQDKVSDILTQFAPLLKMYTNYIRNFDRATAAVVSLRKSNKLFQDFVEANMSNSMGLPLEAFLIMPVQRLPRYPLLIKELIKQTPSDHHDYAQLEVALALVEAVVHDIDEKKQKADIQNTVRQVNAERLSNNPKAKKGKGSRRHKRDSKGDSSDSEEKCDIILHVKHLVNVKGKVTIGVMVGKEVFRTDKVKSVKGIAKFGEEGIGHIIAFTASPNEAIRVGLVQGSKSHPVAGVTVHVAEIINSLSGTGDVSLDLSRLKGPPYEKNESPTVLVSFEYASKRSIGFSKQKISKETKAEFQIFKATATQNHTASREGELSFTVGSIIEVTGKHSETEYYGRIGATSGWFRMSHVRALESPSPMSSRTRKPTTTEEKKARRRSLNLNHMRMGKRS